MKESSNEFSFFFISFLYASVRIDGEKKINLTHLTLPPVSLSASILLCYHKH